MEAKKVAVVGNGRYGSFFADFFQKGGCKVRVSDIGTTPSTEEIVVWADVVLIAVTLFETVKVIEAISPLLREDQLIMDIASVKSGPVRAMLQSEASVLGMHPFTAPPRSGTFKGQTIFICSARISENWQRWVDTFLLETEGNIVEVSTEKHDVPRTVDQFIEHMCTMLKVSVMRRLELEPSDLLKVASPVYRMTSAQMARMFAQSSALYGGIAIANEHIPQTLRFFQEEFERYAQIVTTGDMVAYSSEFDANKEYLGPTNIAESFALSEALVKTMVDMQAK